MLILRKVGAAPQTSALFSDGYGNSIVPRSKCPWTVPKSMFSRQWGRARATLQEKLSTKKTPKVQILFGSKVHMEQPIDNKPKNLRSLTSRVSGHTSWDGWTYESGREALRFAETGSLTFWVALRHQRPFSRFPFVFNRLRITCDSPGRPRLTNWVLAPRPAGRAHRSP